ncbi:MAG: homoserine dehydrogenase [Clostridia bacterium]|nr:homoserine dehydrogenase [Clostridia bacterium]
MISIAILGFGNIGSGVADVLANNEEKISKIIGDEIRIKYVLDKRDLSDTPYADRAVTDIDVIVNDPDVTVVCEMMGGTQPAYDYSIALLKAGKSVVTSNKEVVARMGDLLLATAREHGVHYLYEASVGGGIPILHALDDSLKSCAISRIDGILNGTTNYILTRMHDCNASFESALSEARKLGYAEANPTADISGADACRKIMILAAVAWGKLVSAEDVPCEGITAITSEDSTFAVSCGGALKLIASAVKTASGIMMTVSPAVVLADNPLYSAKGVFNAVKVRAGDLGDVMFYGMGAGKLPTASAVVSDIIAAINRSDSNGYTFFLPNDESLLSPEETPDAFCLLVQADADILYERIPSLALLNSKDGVHSILCEDMSKKTIYEAFDGLAVLKCLRAIV